MSALHSSFSNCYLDTGRAFPVKMLSASFSKIKALYCSLERLQIVRCSIQSFICLQTIVKLPVERDYGRFAYKLFRPLSVRLRPESICVQYVSSPTSLASYYGNHRFTYLMCDVRVSQFDLYSLRKSVEKIQASR